MHQISQKRADLLQSRSTRRVDNLAVLPLFFPLDGRPVLLAGGTASAAWKAELLAAAGATVHVFTEQLDEEFQTLM